MLSSFDSVVFAFWLCYLFVHSIFLSNCCFNSLVFLFVFSLASTIRSFYISRLLLQVLPFTASYLTVKISATFIVGTETNMMMSQYLFPSSIKFHLVKKISFSWFHSILRYNSQPHFSNDAMPCTQSFKNSFLFSWESLWFVSFLNILHTFKHK